ncbi:MAG: hypothetical protein R2769_13455 [Saprospiraceae bacterium]
MLAECIYRETPAITYGESSQLSDLPGYQQGWNLHLGDDGLFYSTNYFETPQLLHESYNTE